MTYQERPLASIEAIRHHLKKITDLVAARTILEFSVYANDLESYAEPMMLARLVGVAWDGRGDKVSEAIFALRVDYSEFDVYNRAFESTDYYDKSHVPRLTAREAGLYRKQDTLYVSPDVLVDGSCQVGVCQNPLVLEFGESGEPCFSTWLASKIGAASTKESKC